MASAASTRKNVRVTGILLVNEITQNVSVPGRICGFVTLLTTKILCPAPNCARIRRFGLSRPSSRFALPFRGAFSVFSFCREVDVLRSVLSGGLALALAVGMVHAQSASPSPADLLKDP